MIDRYEPGVVWEVDDHDAVKIIDMSSLLMQALGAPKSMTIKWIPWMREGDLLRDGDGEVWRIDEIKLEEPDNWMNDQKVCVLHKPWDVIEVRYVWSEDQLFPRLTELYGA